MTILKPLHGDEPRLYDNLASFVRQDYPGEVEIVFGVQRADDPAKAVVGRIVTEHPERRLVLVENGAVHGANLKISNLINMSAQARNAVVVLADSDMSVPSDYLRCIVGALEQPRTGLVTCLYSGRPSAGLWSRLAGLAIDHHFLPSVLVGLRLKLAEPCFGSTIALRADTLRRVGGFEAFADQLADDYALGAAVRGLGLRVAIPPLVLGHTCAEASLSELLAHELRWARTIRLVDPAGHAGSFVTHALPLALIASVLQSSHTAAFGLIALALASRALVQIQVDRVLDASPSRLWWGPVRDLLSFAVFCASLVSGTVTWRGKRFGVTADGIMRPTPEQTVRDQAGE